MVDLPTTEIIEPTKDVNWRFFCSKIWAPLKTAFAPAVTRRRSALMIFELNFSSARHCDKACGCDYSPQKAHLILQGAEQ